MNELKPAAQKVQAAIDAKGLGGKVRHMPQSTRTAEEAAKACGCSVAQIVKSLVFRGAQSGKPYLLLVSGANRVDEKAVAAHLGEALKRPDADYVRGVTGFAIGGIPPLGHDTRARHLHGRDAAHLRHRMGCSRHRRRRVSLRARPAGRSDRCPHHLRAVRAATRPSPTCSRAWS